MSETSSTRAKLFLSILAMLILILIAYANTLLSPFNFDDQALLQNIALSGPDRYNSVWPVQYRHLFYLSFSINHSISGLNPFSYHLTNLLFHFLSSVTVLLIVFKTVSKNARWESKAVLGLSITTALLFALNPLHTEAVTYLSGRASGMGGFFYLLALLFFIMGSERDRNPTTTVPLFYFLTLLAFGLALLSKETTLTFPLAVFLYDLCFMRNESWHPFKGRLFFIYLPLCCLVGAFLILTPEMRNMTTEWLGKIDISYALAQAKVLAYALKLCLFPINLTFDYDFPTHWLPQAFSNFILVMIWLVVVFTVMKNFRRISPIMVFSLLWFLITLSPTNSFLPRADMLSERNLYLPSLGPTFLIAYVFYYLFFMKGSLSKPGLILLLTFFLMMGSLLITRNSVYRSNIHLWEDTYKKSPADLQVLHNLSHFYLEDKRYQQALVPLLRLSRSVASDFYRAFAHSNLGSIYTQNGNFERAKKEFHKAIELEPTLPLGYLNLGTYHASRGEFQRARTEFLRARERYIIYKWGYPMPPDLDLNLARVNLQLKSFAEAEKYIHQYLQGVPDSPEGLLLRGGIYQAEGKIKLAEKAYREIQSGGLVSAKAYNNLGILHIKQNQNEKARDAFNASIKYYPKIADAHYNLGKLILDSKGDRTLAREHLEVALAYNQSLSLKQEINRLL
ncbi:MAG: tetratricopeptide repeat protein, partial [Nitrospinae bacterium]|nr:tetratricopeptide repeat protein [Nitrospinota bacterium]